MGWALIQMYVVPSYFTLYFLWSRHYLGDSINIKNQNIRANDDDDLEGDDDDDSRDRGDSVRGTEMKSFTWRANTSALFDGKMSGVTTASKAAREVSTPARSKGRKAAVPAPSRPGGMALCRRYRIAQSGEGLGRDKVNSPTVAAPTHGTALARLRASFEWFLNEGVFRTALYIPAPNRSFHAGTRSPGAGSAK